MPHSRLASPSATIAALREHDLYTRKSLGQHFLIDDNVVGRIIAMAALGPASVALEIGPGIGTLTLALCSSAGHVIAVERDSRLIPVLEAVALECGNLTLVEADAVTVPLSDLTTPHGAPTALVANLPYSVAATVVLRFFEQLPSLESAVVMVQSEVADRMCALPGSKEYGSYTVKLQLRARPAGRFQVARGCFLPPPRVDSAVVRLERTRPLEAEALLESAARLADAAFAQRRKTLRNSLRATLGLEAGQLERILGESGIDGARRAETLTVDEYLSLAETFTKYARLP